MWYIENSSNSKLISQISSLYSYIEASAPAYNMSGTIGGELTHTPFALILNC